MDTKVLFNSRWFLDKHSVAAVRFDVTKEGHADRIMNESVDISFEVSGCNGVVTIGESADASDSIEDRQELVDKVERFATDAKAFAAAVKLAVQGLPSQQEYEADAARWRADREKRKA